jgi:hypothetical protein
VVACPQPERFELPADGLDMLARVTVVESPLLPTGAARATAVRAASAPIVVLGETHVFPAPDWAERLLRAYEGSPVGVAPGLENANPASALSWAGFLMDYGRWLAGSQPDGDSPAPPVYNGTWRREALLSCGDRLPELLQPGGPLEAELRARGGFSHERTARIAHLNVARPVAWAHERYLGGRVFAAHRSAGWSRPRRLLYTGGSVLVPFIRLARTMPAVRTARRGRRLPTATVPAVALAGALWAVGEAVGYLAGAERAESQMLEYELHKERYA